MVMMSNKEGVKGESTESAGQQQVIKIYSLSLIVQEQSIKMGWGVFLTIASLLRV